MKFIFLILLLILSSILNAQTYYVATNGDNSIGNGSSERPWKTISYGIKSLAPGDTLMVKAGDYSGKDNFINEGLTDIPDGKSGKYTSIVAEKPYSVRIYSKDTSLTYNDYLLLLKGNYIKVEGFVFDLINSKYPPHNGMVQGNYNKIMYTIFRREGNVDEYGGWLYIGGDHNLIEDSAGVGAARYGFETGGPSATSSNNIFRRVVARVDYSNSKQPKAAFATYGNNSGFNVHSVLYQNCIVVDGQKGSNTSQPTYGGWYFPKNAASVTIQGSIVLHNEAEYTGYFLKEQQGGGIKIEHSISWDNYGSSNFSGIRIGGANGPFIADHLTIGSNYTAFYNNSYAKQSFVNSLFLNHKYMYGKNTSWDPFEFNAFSGDYYSRFIFLTTQDKSLMWLPNPTSYPQLAQDQKPFGATILTRYGVTGTLWGEPGYDQLTEEALWPWQYENEIKTVFAQPNNPPVGNMPSSNNTARGFTVSQDQFDQPMTLTRYIWQYLGIQLPKYVYNQ